MTAMLKQEAGIEVILGSLAEIPPGEGREFHVGSHHIAVFHTRSGAVYATDALCPHRQGPLADGLIGGTTVVCPFHARRFDLASGEGLEGDCALRTYAIRLDDQQRMHLTLLQP